MPRIESVSVCAAAVPLDRVTSFSTRTVSTRHYGLVKVRSSDGVEGIGFCYVVDPAAADLTISILAKHGREAQRVGHAVADPQKAVRIPQRNLIGTHKTFRTEERAARKAG